VEKKGGLRENTIREDERTKGKIRERRRGKLYDKESIWASNHSSALSWAI